MDDETYPGTDMLIRFCYSCEKRITEVSDLWVDYDDNCCVCTDCRNEVRDSYGTETEWVLSIVRADTLDHRLINKMEEEG